MTDSEKLDLLLEKAGALEGKVDSLERKVDSLEEKVSDIEKDIIDIKADMRRLHRDDCSILDEVERVHSILDKHKADRAVHTA